MCLSGSVSTSLCVAIVVSAIGLAGGCSVQAVSITGLVTQPCNPVVLVVSVLGLTGNATLGVVSGVTLGSSLFLLMINSVCSCLETAGTAAKLSRS